MVGRTKVKNGPDIKRYAELGEKVAEAKKRGRRGEPMKVISQGPVDVVEQSLVDDDDPKPAAAMLVVPSEPPPPSETELKLAKRIDELFASAERAVINSPATAEKGADLAKLFRVLKAKIEDIRTELVGPPNQYVKKLNARFKKLTTKIDEGREKIDRKVIDFKVAEEKVRREAAEKERLKNMIETPGHELDSVIVPDKPVHQATRGEMSTASVGTRYDFEVVNIAAVPHHLLCVDAVAVRQMINAKGDERTEEIEGLRIFPVHNLSVR